MSRTEVEWKSTELADIVDGKLKAQAGASNGRAYDPKHLHV